MKKVLIHKSGRKTLVNGDIEPVLFEIRDKHGKADEVIEEIQVKEMSDSDFEKMMERPQKFDIKKHGLKTLKKA